MKPTRWFAGMMMTTAAVACASALAWQAMAQNDAKMSTIPAESRDYVVLKVNDAEIKRSDVQQLWQGMFEGRQAPEFDTQPKQVKQNILTGLASEALVFQKAQEAGIDKEAEIVKKIELLKKQLVLQEWVSRQTRPMLTEEALKAAYDKKMSQSENLQEVRVAHILTSSQDDAKKAYDRLKKGEEFSKVAKDLSIEKSSGAAGGEVGWVSKGVAVPSFVDAALALKVGEYSKPVKSPFGYHIILAEERRTKTPTPFAEMRDKIGQEMLGEATREVVQGLLKGADIEYYNAEGERLPFDRTLPSETTQAVQ